MSNASSAFSMHGTVAEGGKLGDRTQPQTCGYCPVYLNTACIETDAPWSKEQTFTEKDCSVAQSDCVYPKKKGLVKLSERCMQDCTGLYVDTVP